MNNSKQQREKLSANRAYKDTIFRWIFSDKENLLSLYNAIAGKNYKDPEKLTMLLWKMLYIWE